jgi:PIN domain nuclease of toxin-antitoxin system
LLVKRQEVSGPEGAHEHAAGAYADEVPAHFREAPLTHEIVLAAHRLPLPHRAPADRFLVATAQTLGLTLVTADDRLLGLGEIKTLANR